MKKGFVYKVLESNTKYSEEQIKKIGANEHPLVIEQDNKKDNVVLYSLLQSWKSNLAYKEVYSSNFGEAYVERLSYEIKYLYCKSGLVIMNIKVNDQTIRTIHMPNCENRAGSLIMYTLNHGDVLSIEVVLNGEILADLLVKIIIGV